MDITVLKTPKGIQCALVPAALLKLPLRREYLKSKTDLKLQSLRRIASYFTVILKPPLVM